MEPQKKANLLAAIAEVNNIKINIADFKTIDANASQEDHTKMCKQKGNGNFHIGWLNDEVCAYIENNHSNSSALFCS